MPEGSRSREARRTHRDAGVHATRRAAAIAVVGAALAVAIGWLASREALRPTPPGSIPGPSASASLPDAPSAPEASERADDAVASSPDVLVPEFFDEREPWIDEHGTPSRELVRSALEAAIADHFPSHKLRGDDVEVLTDSVLRIREARLALAQLPETEEVAPLRRGLVEEIEDAGRSFAEVMEMGVDAFTAGAEGGVDAFDPREPVPAGEFLTESR